MKALLVILLLSHTMSCISQETFDKYVDGEMLRDLRTADTSVFYRYQLDSWRSTYIKFSKRGEIVSYYFDYAHRGKSYLRIDSLIHSRHSYTYALVDGNGNRLFNAITMHSNGVLVIGGYHGPNRYGKNYAYSSKRLSRISEYRNGGIQFGVEVMFDKKRGFKAMERQFNLETGEVDMLVYHESGSVDYRWINSDNQSVRSQYDKKGVLLQIDSIHDKSIGLGSTVVFFPDGVTEISIPVLGPVAHGTVKAFHRNGMKKSEISYDKGVPTGQYFFYNELGEIIGSGIVEQGIVPVHPYDKSKWWKRN